MLTDLEFAKEKYRQFLMIMPSLLAEAEAKAPNRRVAQAEIDRLLDHILYLRKQIQKLENRKKQ